MKKPRVIKKRNLDRPLISAMESLIEHYPDQAERKLRQLRRKRAVEKSADKPQAEIALTI